MIILQLFGVICGLCLMIGVPWATIDTIKKCGFEPGDLVMMPIALALTLFGGGLAFTSFASAIIFWGAL